MAILQNTLIGRASGSIGGVTFSTWKGLNVGKSKPVSVANPDTDPQKAQRSALAQLVAIFRQVVGGVDLGFKKLAVHQSAYNAWMSYNLKNAVSKAGAVATILKQDLLFAKGTVGVVVFTSRAATVSTEDITLAWDASDIPVGGSATDEVSLVVINGTSGIALYLPALSGQIRSSGTAEFAVPSDFMTTGNSLTIYPFFRNPITGDVSDSYHYNVTVVA